MFEDAIDSLYESDEIPKINPIVAEGIAYRQMANVEQIVDRLMRVMLSRENNECLPEGFTYLTYEEVSVEEEYLKLAKEKVKKRASRRSEGFQYNRTDFFLVKYLFQINNNVYEKYLEIPFVKRGGVMTIKGVDYFIMPVIKTRGVSITPKGYFVEFLSNRVNFEKLPRSFLVNGTVRHVYIPVTSELHRGKKDKSKRFIPPVPAWLFTKFGVRGTFKEFLGIDIELVEDDVSKLSRRDPNEYAVCRAPLPFRREKRAPFAVVLKKKDVSQTALILIGVLFYVASFHGDRMPPEFLDDETLWKILLGYAIFGAGERSDQHIVAEINVHLGNIERSMDEIFRNELLMEGVEVNDIYDFLFYITDQVTKLDEARLLNMANLWGRYLTCVEYVTVGIRKAIQSAAWDLVRLGYDDQKQAAGRPASSKDIEQALNKNIHMDEIERIVSGHGELSTLLVTTDNMLVGVTSRAVDQADAHKQSGGSKKVIDLNDPTKHIHASFLEVGSVMNLPKSSPFGWAVLNPYLELDARLKIVPKAKNETLLRAVQHDLRQKGTTY